MLIHRRCIILTLVSGRTLQKQQVMTLITTLVWTAGNHTMFDHSLTKIYWRPHERLNQSHTNAAKLERRGMIEKRWQTEQLRKW